jgi:hypothetical protein
MSAWNPLAGACVRLGAYATKSCSSGRVGLWRPMTAAGGAGADLSYERGIACRLRSRHQSITDA